MSRLYPKTAIAPVTQPWPSVRSCQWPIGEPGTPEFCFCGTPLSLGQRSSYCPQHQERAYVRRPNSLRAEDWLLR